MLRAVGVAVGVVGRTAHHTWASVGQADARGGDPASDQGALWQPNPENVRSARGASQIAAAWGRVGDARAASRLFRAALPRSGLLWPAGLVSFRY